LAAGGPDVVKAVTASKNVKLSAHLASFIRLAGAPTLRPSGRSLRDLLRMRSILSATEEHPIHRAITKRPHPEERAQRASRRTHGRDAARALIAECCRASSTGSPGVCRGAWRGRGRGGGGCRAA